jgi:hypothetical protein
LANAATAASRVTVHRCSELKTDKSVMSQRVVGGTVSKTSDPER